MVYQGLSLLTVAVRFAIILGMPTRKNPHAQALGKLGGLARARRLTSDQRVEASRKANAGKKQRAHARRMLNTFSRSSHGPIESGHGSSLG